MMARKPRPPPGLDYNDDPPSPYHFPSNPLDRYAQLPEHTRKFFESLDEEDIGILKSVIISFRRGAAFAWGLKWIGGLFVGTFTAFVAFGEKFEKAYAWFVGR